MQLCGEVNAKNRFGAYIGYNPFYVSGRSGAKSFIDNDGGNFATEMCGLGAYHIMYSEP